MPHSKIRRYMKHGTMPQLAVFEASARLGSYTRAAEELHLAQPTVSGLIKRLTETVGLSLFEQVGTRIFLTEPGRRLHRSCEALFRTFAEAEETFEGFRALRSGRLQVAVCTSGKYFATRMLAEFVRMHAGLEVSLEIHNRRALLDRLARNEDDLYIFANPPQESEAVRQAILPNPMVAFAHADHPLAGKRAIPLARLAQEPLLMREPGSGTRMVVEALFRRHGLEPRVRMELGTNEAVKQAILAGLGVSILSRYTLGLDCEQRHLKVLDVEELPLEGYWYFAYPIGKRLSPPAGSLMEFVRAEANRLVQDVLQYER
jgi:DNA-binding transcriptional LysR family regulator